MSKMQIWLILSVNICLVALLNAGNDSSFPSDASGRNTVKNKYISKAPMELNINFTFPENGLPPLKLNLGNIAAFLTEKNGKGNSNGNPSSGKPVKKTVVVNIKNPNKPQNPIAADVFTAGLPQGFQIPVNPAQVCRDFIVSKCRDVCAVTQRICHSMCDGRMDCVQLCRATQSTCTKFCNSTFTGEAVNIKKGFEQQLVDVLLPKCLRNCRYNRDCTNRCHDTCHAKLMAPAPLTDVLSTVPVSLPPMFDSSVISGLPIVEKPSKGDLIDFWGEKDSWVTNENN